MTFEQFQATRTECADIGAAISTDMGITEPVPGFLYLGTFYIEGMTSTWPDEARAQGTYHLLIERDEWISDDLEALERHLFEFALASGAEMGIDDLCAEYKTWNKAQGLNLSSADEHLADETLSEEQRGWLRDFSSRWEEAEQRARRHKCQHRDSGRGVCIDCGAAL
ncbi:MULTISPECIES: hypothetical protein [unclassified Bradyrhizobium]|uniref:hypothetical protein n=1 Tax=Bradyrhizobium sp. USDA 4541 TaxID=2817704 RepID=UPI0020A49563|nr:hypothetical protein [Bradyrhizobium sp. USDA 4541]MCP1852824.1 hypothetical protein [Bradyrhizobium sp. USDA 4541]